MAYQSQMARQALRSALRSHPNASSVLTDGRKVNDLRLEELYAALRTLGENPDGIARAALASPQPAPQVNTYTCPDCGALAMLGTPHQCRQPAPDELRQDQDQEEKTLTENDAVEAELGAIRALITTGGFTALDGRLRELVIAAHKPPVEVIREIQVEVAVAPGGAGPVILSRPSGAVNTWRNLFGCKGELGKRETKLWTPTPETPAVNDHYVFPHPQTETALTQLHRGRNVMLYGPAGTGKTDWAQQLAAKTGRPFALISCDAGTDAATLVGMTVPDAAGGVAWQDGQLARAIQVPGCVVCIDEPSLARPGALFVFQNVLQNRELFIAETGRRVKVAPGVVFLCCDNTNGTGGGSRKGYTDTNRLNAAFLDRWGARVRFDYLDADAEANIIVSYTGCTKELAQLLVSAAAVTRAAADQQTVSHGIGLRRLLSWAELLSDGIGPEEAFQSAVLNCAPEQDVEALREQCLLAYSADQVRRALNPNAPTPQPDPSVSNPTAAGRDAASDFSDFNNKASPHHY